MQRPRNLEKHGHRKRLGPQGKNRICRQAIIGASAQVPLGGRGEAVGEQMEEPPRNWCRTAPWERGHLSWSVKHE